MRKIMLFVIANQNLLFFEFRVTPIERFKHINVWIITNEKTINSIFIYIFEIKTYTKFSKMLKIERNHIGIFK